MINIITIILFFIYTWGLGFTATYFVKQAENWLERTLMNIGIGLGTFAVLSILINFLRIPLDWKIFLVLSLIIPGYDLYKKIKNKSFNLKNIYGSIKLKKSDLAILLVLLIFAVSFYVYLTGAFSYPYLEDEDPWGHAVDAKYVALEKDAYDPPLKNQEDSVDPILSYMDPYPPAYDILLGVLHQTSPDLTWTLKFFNALIISLGFIFFYFFAKNFIGNRNKALFATFAIAAIPCYFSHFIWSHSLVVTLFFPAMYAFENIKSDKKWAILAALMVAGIWLSQNFSEPVKLTTMLLIYIIVWSITSLQFKKYEFFALIGGMLLSLIWFIPIIFRKGFNNFLNYYGAFSGEVVSETSSVAGTVTSKPLIFKIIGALFSPEGSASRAYNFKDFLIAKGQNMINSPIGIGIVLSILVLAGMIYALWKYKQLIVTENNRWLCITLFWLIFTFWGVNGMTFPVSVARGAFRTWVLMAIPVSLMASEGLFFIKAFFKSRIIKLAIVLLVIIGVIFTSASAKYELNTATWPTSGTFSGPQEVYAYAQWFNTLSIDTKVFLYSPRDKITIGLGKFSCIWCQEVVDFRKEILYKNVDELHSFLKENEYRYLVINGQMDKKYFNINFGANETDKHLPQRYQEILNSSLFTPTYQEKDLFIALKVN